MGITASYYLPYFDDPIEPNKSMVEIRGGSRIFSRGAYFQKNFENLVYFFEVDQIDFPSSLKALQNPVFAKISAPQAKFGRNMSKKALLSLFWKILTKKWRFFGVRSPSKLVFIGAEGAFRKNLRSVIKKGFLIIVQRGDPLGQQGVKSLIEGGGGGVRGKLSSYAFRLFLVFEPEIFCHNWYGNSYEIFTSHQEL